MEKGINISIKEGRRVVEGLGYYKPRVVSDMKELIKGSSERFAHAVAFRYKNPNGEIIEKSYVQIDQDVDAVGTALMSLGLLENKISIISENRYEWAVSYFSIVNGTGVAVPLDKYLPQNEVINLIHRGRVEAIFYSPAFHPMMLEISKTQTSIKYFICMEELTDGGLPAEFITFPSLIKNGQKLLKEGDTSFVDLVIDREKMSVLLFTSGTTAISKGVMLSHKNITSNVTAMSTVIYAGPGDVHLSLLPLHHTFENSIGLLFMLHSGVCISFCEGIKHIVQNLKEFHVTILVAVPAILEAMYKKLQEGIKKSGKEKKLLFFMNVSDLLLKVGIDVRRKLFKSVLAKLGPDLRLAVSGAAAIDPQVVIGFGRIGIPILEGYGLTETSPVLAANNDFINIPGSICYPIAGVEMTIDLPDENGIGEILARGKNVMIGYYENEEATREVIDSEGWFRTGDLGTMDEQGIIRITGRAKSMIVLTNGKKAFPEEYEVLINQLPYVKDSFVWGNRTKDGDVQVCAEIEVDTEVIKVNNSVLTAEELGTLFQKEIRDINKMMPQYKIIRYFVIIYHELIKTTTLKIKRPLEQEKIMKALNAAGIDMRKASGMIIEHL